MIIYYTELVKVSGWLQGLSLTNFLLHAKKNRNTPVAFFNEGRIDHDRFLGRGCCSECTGSPVDQTKNDLWDDPSEQGFPILPMDKPFGRLGRPGRSPDAPWDWYIYLHE